MRLPSFLQRKSASGARRVDMDEATVQQERRRARRRLIGAAVLVLIGVVGLPMIFDRAPRPLPVDIAIDIPRKDAAPPLPAPPASKPARKEGATDPGVEAVPPVAPVAKTEPPAEKPAEKVVEKPSTKVADKPADKPVDKIDVAAAKKTSDADAERARAALEGRPQATRAAASKAESARADATGRFVVQVGAFSEADAAREARTRVEKLGFKTYVQSVDTGSGKRIRVRVGPYDDRAEADKVAAQIKKAGIASAVMAL